MPLAPSITTAARNAAANAVTVLVDADVPAGRLRIYNGTPSVPADVTVALSGQTLLADLPMADPAFGAASGGVATAGAITSAIAGATGTAAFFRVVTGTTFTAVFQGSVGTSGSDLNLSTTAINLGGTVAVTSLTYSQAGS